MVHLTPVATNNLMVVVEPQSFPEHATNLATVRDTTAGSGVEMIYPDTPPRHSTFADEGTPLAGSTNERYRQGRFLNGFGGPHDDHHNQHHHHPPPPPPPPHDDLAGLVVQTTSSMDNDLYPRPSVLGSDDLHQPVNSSSSSNDCIMMQSMMLDLKRHLDKTLVGFKHETRRDFDKVFLTLQQESAKRTALEQNLHAQLLLQSETMMAMELKLLRLEARVERRREATPSTGGLSSQEASISLPAARSPPAPPTPETRQQQSIRPRTTYPNQPQQLQQAQNSINNNVTEQLTNSAALSSGASLASAVAAGSLAGREGEDREDDVGSQQSTPTQGSGPADTIAVGNLDAILHRSSRTEEESEHNNMEQLSVRAIRTGDIDDNSSFGTAITASTHASQKILPITGGNLDSLLQLNPELGEEETASSTMSVRAIRADTDGNSSLGTAFTAVTQSTQGSSSILLAISGGTIGSILMDPTLGERSVIADSLRVIRDVDEDADSSIGTNITVATPGSRPVVPIVGGGNLDSILLDPPLSASSGMRESIRAIRGDTDGNSSLGTSFTNSTMTSTIATSTLLRPDAIRGRQRSEESFNLRQRVSIVLESDPDPTRSRSNSPLTVQSYTAASDAQSATSTSAGQSATILSSVAVAAPRIGRSRSSLLRGDAGAPADAVPIRDRVVSFSSDLLQNEQLQNLTTETLCDDLTMPDELDNLSEVADIFSTSARAWREDYEARLDALQKRWANE